MHPICRNVACARRHDPMWNCNDPRSLATPLAIPVANTFVANKTVSVPEQKTLKRALMRSVVVVDSGNKVVRKSRYKDLDSRRRYMRLLMQTKRAVAAGKAEFMTQAGEWGCNPGGPRRSPP